MSRRTVNMVCLALVLGVALTVGIAGASEIKINFQSAGAPIPDGYLPDTGQIFGDRGNGYTYGWSLDMSDQTRDRNNSAAPDQRYDTLIHFRGRGGTWEIELPAGIYRVFIVCGDPSNADSNNAIELEGELLAEDPDGLDSFDEFEFTVIVSDGRLTWSEPAGTYVKPCFIEIESTQPLVRANKPNPKDGSVITDTWANLAWSPGELAVSHDVYLSDNFDDVNDGAEAAFQGNRADTSIIAGFPGFPYPDGLVPGTTYYWRVDEINTAEPNSPWKGDVWSFSIPPQTAYAPVPADGAKFIAPDVQFTWTPGFGAKLHTVYFGDNFDDVSNAQGGPPRGTATFTPAGPLEPQKTYYWRVDELNPPVTHKGDVWSFQVAKEGGGIKADYYQGMSFQNLVLTRTDPQIDFNWGNPGGPDPLVGDNQFSARWTGEVEAVFTETYTFYTNSDDGVRLWVDGKRVVNNWTNHSNTENSGKIDLVGGQTYSVVMEYYEDGGGAVAQLRWSSPRTPKDLIPSAALSHLTKANTPMPRNGSVGAKLVSTLTWKPGDSATSHEVYFGTDAEAVADATKASPEYKGAKQLGSESLDPGNMAFNTDYFWRVDEVITGATVKGNLWSFNTGAFLLVDDFESYNDIDLPDATSNRIFDSWIDGFGTTTNGALAGNDLPPYAELTDIHGGEQALPYRYDNNLKTSEATLTLVYPKDFTEEGVTKLSLWFKGNSGNSAERMFVALNGNAVVYHDDAAATQINTWTEWVIDLQAFSGVALTNVNTITIGIGTKGSPAAGGTGTMLIDDIRLIPALTG